MKKIEKFKLWMSIMSNDRIYNQDRKSSIDHCLSWLLTHKVFDIKYECHDTTGCKLYEYHEIGDKIPYRVIILFGDDQTDQKYILKMWNANKWYAFGNEGSVSFWPNYSDKDANAYIIHNWKKCVPKKSIVYKLAKLMIEWEENKSKSTDKPGVSEN